MTAPLKLVAPAAYASRGNSNDDIRRHNLSVVLGLVHREHNQSRAQLTRATGLNRSTVAGIVAELVDRNLVVEAEPHASLRGRPSQTVWPNPAVVSIAINPEVDAVSLGLVSLDGTIVKKIRYITDRSPSVREVINISVAIIDAMRADLEAHYLVVGIGVAIPGQVQSQDGSVRLAPPLGWENQPIAQLLSEATGFNVFVANDAHAGVLAESKFGAGRGVDELVYLYGGPSGIGAGIISNGKAVRGAGFAGGLGHTLVRENGFACRCGSTGCLETEARREQLLPLIGLENADEEQLEAALIDAAMIGSGSPEVLAEVHRQIDYLAVALRNTINILNPRLISVGGFLASLTAVAPGRLESLLATHSLVTSFEGVRIARAELGSNFFVGAAELAFESLLENPQGFRFEAGAPLL